MAILWLSASVLVLGVLAILIPVLLRARESRALARNDVNVAIAREREKELRRDLQEGLISDADYDAARAELEQGLALDLGDGTAPPVRPAGSPIVAVAISALLPVFALGLYLALGTPDAPNLERASQEATANATTQPDVATMLAEMRLRLEDRPDDVRGWTLYANALMGTGRYNEAVPAYRRLKALQPDNPEVVVRLADAIAMTQGGVLGGEPESLISEALQLQPNHPQGLWLFGIAKEQQGAFDEALAIFNRLAPMVANEPEVLSEVQAVIERITAAKGADLSPVTVFRLLVNISVDERLKDAISPSDTLFVFARAADGPPMPIAAQRLAALPLPRQVLLSDNDLLMAGASLASYPLIQIGALISKSGSVSKAAGDLSGLSEAIVPSATSTVSLSINEQIQ